MNSLMHFFFNFVICSAVFGVGREFLPLIFVFSVLLDIDHLPYLLKHFKATVRQKRIDVHFRTRFHEAYGLFVISLVCAVSYLLVTNKRVESMIQIAALCLILHMTLDFLAGHSRPLAPYSEHEVFLNIFRSNKIRLFAELMLTTIFGVITWLIIY